MIKTHKNEFGTTAQRNANDTAKTGTTQIKPGATELVTCGKSDLVSNDFGTV